MLRLFVLLAALLGASPLAAQPLPERLEWELVGSVTPTGSDSLAFINGVAFHRDTLLATGQQAAWAFDPTADTWTNRRAGGLPLSMRGPIVPGEELGLSPAPLFLFRGSSLYLSDDAGRSWSEVLDHATTLPARTPSGRLVAGHNGLISTGDAVAFSADDGRSWELGTYFPGDAGVPKDFAALDPSSLFPQGRLVSADFLGLAYSADEGETWHRSTLAGPYRSYSVTAVQPGPRDGDYAGRFVAGVVDFTRFRSYVYTSDDGGETWTERFAYPVDGERSLFVVAAPDGAVYMYNDQIVATRNLFGSADGGQTWQDLGPMGAEWRFAPTQMTVGPDGRLYVGGHGGGAGPNPAEDEPAGGVFRTVQPVVSTAAEPPSPEPASFGVRVYPNPSGGAVTLALSGTETGDSVRLVVYDGLGREVAAVHDGPTTADARFTLAGAALTPGSYIARAEAGGAVAAATFTIAD